ncbi:limonene-1,2-epoxide hydrolase family protein [Microbacterium sp. X-17]|uniref:limonene-1,2-epoxide hydrolase family protein n=1 Tax=Microbacterium sp. X-17 TaxID=3144404 RepID=UPI0031F47C92
MPCAADVVRQFLDHLNAQRIDAAGELLADDVFYHNIPMDPIVGRAGWRASMDASGLGTALLADWKLVSLAQDGDIVLTERLDDFLSPDGKLQLSIPVMGSFRVSDGRIVEWRDYFDMGQFERQLASLGTAG